MQKLLDKPSNTATLAVAAANPPRLLILGGGAVVRECYLPALEKLGWAETTLIVDASEQSLLDLAKMSRRAVARRGDFAALLGTASIVENYDGAIVALPNHLHEGAVVATLAAGLPVLCEKPLALTSDACSRIAHASTRSARPVMVGMVRRFLPSVRAIHQAIGQGLIGEVVSIDIAHGSRFAWPSDSGNYFVRENGGALVNMGIHYLDMVESWIGQLLPREYRDDVQGGVEANFQFDLVAARGAAVRIAISFTHSLRNSIVIVGTCGTIRADVNVMDRCTWESDSGLRGEITVSPSEAVDRRPYEFSFAFTDQLLRFAEVITGGRVPDVGPGDAARTHHLIDWAATHREDLHTTAKRSSHAPRPTLNRQLVVVTGGTGFVGTKLVQRLCELDFPPVTVPVRSYRTGAALGCFPARRQRVDLLRYNDVEQVIKGSRHVFHLAYGGDSRNAADVTVKGTRNVVEAAIQCGVESVVVVSTTAVFGHSSAVGVVDEASRYRPDLGEYANSKAKAEQYCLARAQSSAPTRIVVLNPSFIYGPGAWLVTEFPARAVRTGQFCWLDEGRGRLNFTFVENFVDALLLAARTPAAHGERFIINDGTCSIREFITCLLGPLAEKLPSYSVQELNHHSGRATWRDLLRAAVDDDTLRIAREVSAIRAVGNALERTCPTLMDNIRSRRRRLQQSDVMHLDSKPRAVVPEWLCDFFGPMKLECSAAKAKRVLGWAPLVDLDEGLRLSRSWLQQLGLRI